MADRRFRSRFGVQAGVLGLALGLVAVGATAVPALADAPEIPVAEFSAPTCVGETSHPDPTNAPGPVSDLTRVFGQRLDDYNNGQVVVLYDTFGANSLDGYPAVCGTRYVEGVGAVSEWMFCTDIWSHVCSGVNEHGDLLDYDGTPIAGLVPLSGNPKLSADQEKLIAWLIQNGHSYSGTGYYDYATRAVQDGNSMERASLQVLVWCISDPVDPATTNPTELDRQATCTENMSPAEQEYLLAQIPDDPTIVLALSNGETDLAVGETASFELETNLYDQPISVAVGGVAGELVVSSGPAVYDPDTQTLTVSGADPAVSTVVGLAFTADTVGTVSLELTAEPASRDHLAWDQSPAITASDERPCQVFATFRKAEQVRVVDAASATFGTAIAPEPTPAGADADGAASPSGSRTELARTGTNDPLVPAAGVIALALAGAALLLGSRRRGVRAGRCSHVS